MTARITTITTAKVIAPDGTEVFTDLADAPDYLAEMPGSYVCRVWEFDPATREYVFDTGIDTPDRPFDAAINYSPVCIFPQPA